MPAFVTLFFICNRPLTQEEIAAKREVARQRFAEKQAASAADNKELEKKDNAKEGKSCS